MHWKLYLLAQQKDNNEKIMYVVLNMNLFYQGNINQDTVVTRTQREQVSQLT